MTNAQLDPVLHHVRRLVAAQQSAELSDQQLMQVFARDNDQLAFAALVERHGGLVSRVCRHVLQHVQDAEDAFQATFFVLARRARSIRKTTALASWLHGVAYRMAMKTKRDAARRRNHERQAVNQPAGPTAGELTWREVQAVLDQEIAHLPDKYRSAFVLCCQEGRSRTEAARQLGVKEGTLSSRLAYARQRLQKRLALRGVSLAAVLAGSMLSTSTVSAALIQSTAQGASLFAAGTTSALSGSALSASAILLAQGALRTMFVTKMRAGLSVLAAVGVLTLGTGVVVRSGSGLADARASSASDNPAPAASNSEQTAATSDGIFRDITVESGIDFTYHNGESSKLLTPLETLGGGIGVLDYDGDGLLDLFITGGGYFGGADGKQISGQSGRLYRNLGGGRFADVTLPAGLDGADFYSHGVAVVDYDCDGWPDLLITGWGSLALYHNEKNPRGGRHFVNVTAKSGLPAGLWTTGAAFADLDGDGFPDLYLCQYLDWSFANDPVAHGQYGQRVACPPKGFGGLPHKLFRNNGDGTFTDVTRQAGLVGPGKDSSKGLGVVIADVDNDGKPDIFVANDTTDHFLYRNQSQPGRIRLIEIGMPSGIARDERGVPNGSRGIAVGDHDSSGHPSLFVTNYEGEMPGLYKNLGNCLFLFSSPTTGLGAVGQDRSGWGTAFLDYDNDGDLDLFIANGFASKDGQKPKPVLMRNKGRGRFVEITVHGGSYFQDGHDARGVVAIDLDNDGRLDLVISHLNEPVVVLHNQAATRNHWIGFELVGKNHRDLVGAKVVVETDTRTQTSFAHSGGSYLSSSDRRHLFGLGQTEKVKRIRVKWPGGQQQQWDGLATDRYWRLTEGEGAEEARGKAAE